MLTTNTKSFSEIRTYLDRVPVVEAHEHYLGVVKPVKDILGFIIGNYYNSDFESAAFGMESQVAAFWAQGKKALPFEERLAIFQQLYKKSDKTAYARGMQMGLKECWGIEDLASAESIRDLEQKFQGRDQAFYDKTMARLGIKAKIVDEFGMKPFIQGDVTEYSKFVRFAFSLPGYHNIHTKADINQLDGFLDRPIITLDDYMESFEIYFKKCVEFGIVCVKDQSAYRRTLGYENPAKADAEAIFNEIISNPRDVVGDGRARKLDDWLFHSFMRIAAKYKMPVQLHTGHMAGIRNDIVKTNAANLTPVLELHQNVKFDLFHGNWPYMDEYLFLGKNYPNVWLNLCWVQCIDPIYCIEFMKRAVMTVPHSKIFAFGGDTGEIEWVAGYLAMARDNVAYALSELVDSGWLNMTEARQIAADWFFNNPNEFFNLGMKPAVPELI